MLIMGSSTSPPSEKRGSWSLRSSSEHLRDPQQASAEWIPPAFSHPGRRETVGGRGEEVGERIPGRRGSVTPLEWSPWARRECSGREQKMALGTVIYLHAQVQCSKFMSWADCYQPLFTQPQDSVSAPHPISPWSGSPAPMLASHSVPMS